MEKSDWTGCCYVTQLRRYLTILFAVLADSHLVTSLPPPPRNTPRCECVRIGRFWSGLHGMRWTQADRRAMPSFAPHPC